MDIKLGVHAGPCIAVNLNSTMDYFGTTVNVAARVQATAKEKEIWISEEIYKCDKCENVIGKYMKSIYRAERSLKGLSGIHALYSIPLGEVDIRR